MKISRCLVRTWPVLLLLAIGAPSCKTENDQPGTNTAGPGEQKTELIISAAASMKDALTAIGRDYRKTHPDVELSFNFGSSGALQKQIEQGASADLFIAAADKNIDE